MDAYWPFLIAGAVIIFYSKRIDQVAKANPRVKKFLIGICVVLGLTTLLLAGSALLGLLR